MKPWEMIGCAQIPDGGGELRLMRHDGDYVFRAGRIELMNSRIRGSEEGLAELAIERLADPATARILVGGLGMGFTLARALALVGDRAQVEVVELVPEVIDWNREILGELAGHPLRDPRVTLAEGDVASVIRDAKDAYDAILLDVDNGPEGLTRPANDRIYSRTGLSAARQALRPGGVLAIWSSTPDAIFTHRLGLMRFEVETRWIKARRDKGPKRTIWLATRKAGRARPGAS